MNSIDIVIEKLTDSDRLETANVMMQAFNYVDQDWSEDESLKYVDRIIKTNSTYIAKISNKVVGFVSAEVKDDHIFVEAIATLPEYMGHGVAKALWASLVELAKSQKLSTLKMIADPKSIAYQWYLRLGFEETGWVELSKELK